MSAATPRKGPPPRKTPVPTVAAAEIITDAPSDQIPDESVNSEPPSRKKPPPRKQPGTTTSPAASSAASAASASVDDNSDNIVESLPVQPVDRPAASIKPAGAPPRRKPLQKQLSTLHLPIESLQLRTVFVGNFPIKEEDFGSGFADFEKDTMEHLSSFGTVEKLSIPRSGVHRGEIYIHYASHQEAEHAVAELNGVTIETRKVTATLVSEQTLNYANEASMEAETTELTNSVSSDSNETKSSITPAPAPIKKNPPPRKSATPSKPIQTETVSEPLESTETPSFSEADSGTNSINSSDVGPKPQRKGPPPRKPTTNASPSPLSSSTFLRTVLMKNIPITDEDLESGYEQFCSEMKEEFEKHGEVERLVVPRSGPRKGEIFVTYTNEVNASIAQSELHAKTFSNQVVDAFLVHDSQANDAISSENTTVTQSSKPKGPPPRKSASAASTGSSSGLSTSVDSDTIQSSPKRGPPPRKESPSAGSDISSSPSASKRPPPPRKTSATPDVVNSDADNNSNIIDLKRTLFIKNLPFDDNDLSESHRVLVGKDMRQQFIKFGNVTFLAIVSSGDLKGLLVLQYSNEEEALKAFSATQGKVVAGKELVSTLELDSAASTYNEFALINDLGKPTLNRTATSIPGSPKRLVSSSSLSDSSSIKSSSDRPNKPKPAEVLAARDSMVSKAQKEAEEAAMSARAAVALVSSVTDVIEDDRQNFHHAITVASRAAAESAAKQVARISEMRADENTKRALEDAARITNQIKSDALRKEKILLEDTERQLKAMKEDAARNEKSLKEDAERRHAAFKEEAEKREKMLKEEAEKKAKAIKEEAEMKEKVMKEEAEKKEKFLREEAERKAKSLKEEAEKKEQALRDEADKYQRAVRAEAEKHLQLVKEAQKAEERRTKEDEKIMYSLAKNTHDYERAKKQAEEERALREEALLKLRAAEIAKDEALKSQMKFQISAINAIAAAQSAAMTQPQAVVTQIDNEEGLKSLIPEQVTAPFSEDSLERKTFMTSWEARIKARVGDVPLMTSQLSDLVVPQSSFSPNLSIPISAPAYQPVSFSMYQPPSPINHQNSKPVQKASTSYLLSGQLPRSMNPVQITVEGPDRLVAEREALDRSLSTQQAQLESLKKQQESLQKSINETQQSTFIRSYFDTVQSNASRRSPSPSKSPLLPSGFGFSPIQPGRISPQLTESASAAAAVSALFGNTNESELANFAPTNIFNAPPPTPLQSSIKDDHEPPPLPSRRTHWTTLPALITQELVIKRPDKEESKLSIEANGIGPSAIGFKVLRNRLSNDLSTFTTASAISFGDNITQAMLHIDKQHVDLLKEDEARLSADLKAALDESKVLPDDVKTSIQTTPMLSLALAFHTVDCALVNMRETKDDASPWNEEKGSSTTTTSERLPSAMTPFAGETIVALLGGVSNQVSASAAAVTSSLATASASEEIMWKTVKGQADMRALLLHGDKLVTAAREQGELNLESKFHEWRDVTAAESVLKDSFECKVRDLIQLQAILREGHARVRSLRLHCSAERARMDASILAHARDIAEFEGYNLVSDEDADADVEDLLRSSSSSNARSGQNNSENLQRRKGGNVEKLSLKRLLKICDIESIDSGRSRRLGKSLAATVRETTVFFEIVFGEKMSRYREEVARRLVAVKRDMTRSDALERHNPHTFERSPSSSPSRQDLQLESDAEARERRLREWESGGSVPKATERTFYYPEEKAIARVYSKEIDDATQAKQRDFELKEARASEFAILKRLTTINEQLTVLTSSIKKAAELSRMKKIVNDEWKHRDLDLRDDDMRDEEHHGRANFLRAVIRAESYSAPFFSALLDAEARLRAKGEQERARFLSLRPTSSPQQKQRLVSSSPKGRSRLVTPADYDSASSTSQIPVIDGQLDSLPSNQSFAASTDAYTRTEKQLQESFFRGTDGGAKTKNTADVDYFAPPAPNTSKRAPIAYSSQRGYSAPLSFFQRAAMEEEARKVRHSAVQRKADEYEMELSKRKVYKETQERALKAEMERRETTSSTFGTPFWDEEGNEDLPPLPRGENPPQRARR